jgi:hypothetical protein
LVESRDHRIQLWKGAMQRPFHQSLVAMVHWFRRASNRKRGDEIKKISSPLKLPSQSQPNFAEMILGWFPSKSVSETICSIRTKFGWNSHRMVLFQKYVFF